MEEEPRWIADEMLGRLARYLRFLGYDVLYARGWTDRAILDRSKEEERRVLTRDVLLAKRAGFRAILLFSHALEEQLREVRRAYPALREEVAFVRCSACNGPLVLADHSTPEPPRGVPQDLWASETEVHLCPACGHAYWEGTHTREIRETFVHAFRQPAGLRFPAPRRD